MASQPDSKAPLDPQSQDGIQEILHKVIIAHQQALALLQQTEAAYSRLIPHQLLNLLHAKSVLDVKLGDQVERKMTILFSDIRDFTPLSESMTPAENFEFINSYLSQMEPVISRHNGIIDKYIGDAIMALFEHSADDALNGAIAMLERLIYYNAGRKRASYQPIRIGIGLNTGRVMIGTVGGVNRMDSTVIGDAVNLAARLEEATKTYNVPLIISHNTLYDLADPERYHIRFLDRVRVKGKHQPLSLYEVFNNDPAPLCATKQQTRAMFEQAVACYHMKDIGQSLHLIEQCLTIAPDDFPAQIYRQRCRDHQSGGQHLSTGELQSGLAWGSEYQTGIDDLDRAHRALMQQLDALIAKIATNTCDSCIGIYATLENHAARLFPIEEQIMRERNYPFREAHMREHQHFIRHFRDLQQRSPGHTEDVRYLAYRTALLLLDWFSAHVAKADRHFARHMQTGKA